jgi:hypothetical protein
MDVSMIFLRSRVSRVIIALAPAVALRCFHRQLRLIEQLQVKSFPGRRVFSLA